MMRYFMNLKLDQLDTEGVLFNFHKLFITLILLIQMLSILVFLVLDILLFYISFEAILLPMFFLIGYFGSRDRKIEANYLFVLYTIFGSLFLLLSIIT